MVLPPRLNRSELVRCQQRTERLLNCLTDEAEAWAAAGSRKVGEIVMTPQTASPPRCASSSDGVSRGDEDIKCSMRHKCRELARFGA